MNDTATNVADAITSRHSVRAFLNAPVPRETIERLRPTFPAGIETSIVADQSIQIKDMVAELENTEKFTADDARNFIEKLKRDGIIYERHPGFYSKA